MQNSTHGMPEAMAPLTDHDSPVVLFSLCLYWLHFIISFTPFRPENEAVVPKRLSCSFSGC